MKKNGLLAALVIIIAVGNVSGQWNRYSIDLSDIKEIETSQDGQTTLLLLKNHDAMLSTDGCESWNRVHNLDDESYVFPYSIQVLDEESFIISTNERENQYIYLTNDSGQSWSEIHPDSSLISLPLNGLGIIRFKIDPRVQDRWICALGDGIAVSDDGGGNWVTTVDYLHWRLTKKIWLNSENPNDIYLLGWNEDYDNYGLINYSNDNGATWDVMFYPWQTDLYLKEAVDMSILDNGTILVVAKEMNTNYPRLLSSSNHGESWNDIGIISDVLNENAAFFTSELFPGSLFFFDGEKILESTDDGQTWVENRIGIPNPGNSISAININTQNSTILVNTDGEGLYQTVNGSSWEAVNTPRVTIFGYNQDRMEFYEDGVFITGGNGHKYYKGNSSDNFEKYTYQIDEDSTLGVIYHLFRNDDLLVFYGYKKSNNDGGTASYLFTSEDNGESFSQQRVETFIGGLLYCLVRIYGFEEDGQHVVRCLYQGIGISNTLVKTSIDFGENWIDNTYDWMLNANVYSIENMKIAVESDRDVEGYVDPKMKLSYDGGESWISPEIPGYENRTAVYCHPVWVGNNVYTFFNNELYEFTLNDGWEFLSTIRESGQINSFYFDSVPGDGNENWFVGGFENESEVFISNPGGTEWRIEDYGLEWEENGVEIRAVRYDQYRDLVWFSTSDGLYSVAANTLGVEDSAVDLPIDYRVLQAYPNPFNPTTQIRYTINQSGAVQLKVFDILGREVGRLVNSKKTPGIYTVNLDGSNLSSGTYFIQLETPSGLTTNKISLVK